MTRRTKRTLDLLNQLIKLLEEGNTDQNACALVGIGRATLYEWIEKYPDIADRVTRARSVAHKAATDSLMHAIKGGGTKKSAKTTIYSETRLRKVVNEDGKVIEEPYEYTRKSTEQAAEELDSDWRASLEYLKRRDPVNWAETFVIKITQEQAEIFKQVGMTPAEGIALLTSELALQLKEKNDGTETEQD